MNILIVEDEKELCALLEFQLRKEGYEAVSCHSAEDARETLAKAPFDLILLDRMLPKEDGLTFLKKYRGDGGRANVILLTAMGEIRDRVDGLDSGADDYMVKPFSFEELCARIRSLKRRPGFTTRENILCYEDLSLLLTQAELTGPSGSCRLSKTEASLLALFLQNPKQVVSRDTILLQVWGPESEIEDGNIDNFIYFIRRRLRTVRSRTCLKTVRGLGYRLENSEEYIS